MILNDMLHKPALEYIKKERFTGSYQGMRYFLEKKKTENGKVINTCAWPEPLCFEKTDELLKHFMEFDFSDDGLNEAIQWLSNKQDEMCNNR